MNPELLTDLSRLCIHTITTRQWNLEECVKNYSARGVKGITVWRDALTGREIKNCGKMIRDAGIEIVSLCRGGFFPSVEKEKRIASIDDNRKAIFEAHELGAPLIVLVCGAAPRQSLEDSRNQILDGINAIIPDAVQAGIKLAIEPLHPMYADSRSAINTIRQANEITETINNAAVGIAVDVYHLWWDPDLETEIMRCGTNSRLFAFHVCDWKTPTSDLLNDRGIMGEGCIPVRKIRSYVERAGFKGFNEVEIFSNSWWKADPEVYLNKIIDSYYKYT
jgi:sugar phosphate isomerase/epimerase